jgi:lipopolysaccharide export system permease protein
MIKTIHRYIFNEIWMPFLTGLTVLLFIVLASKMLNISEWVVTHNVRIILIFKMILYLMPGLMLFALPAIGLMATLVAFLRMSGDNEIIAMKSLGISISQMLPPVIIIATVIYFSANFLSIFAAPWGQRAFKNLIFDITQDKSDLGIKERIFCRPFAGITIYVQETSSDDDKVMKDVFLVDARDLAVPYTIIAKQARISFNPALKIITINFSNATTFRVQKDFEKAETGEFESYSLNIGLSEIMANFSNRKQSAEEMSLGGLWRALKNEGKDSSKNNELLIELMQRFAIPLSVFFMVFIGFTLGTQLKSGGRIAGIILGLGIFICYYLFWIGVRSLGEMGLLAPNYGTWIPTIFLCISYFYLFKRSKEERPVKILEKLMKFKIAK